MIVEGLPLWITATNAWIVAPSGPGGECVLVDAPPDPGALRERLRADGLRLVAVLLTHGHVDHLGGVEVVHDHRPPVPVHLHPDDHYLLSDPEATGAGLAALVEAAELDLRPPELLVGLDDGQTVRGAGMTFTALHTPGHTPGSTCFLLEVEGEAPILFSGDHLFAGSIGRTDLRGGSYQQLMESMVEKILPLDDEIRVLPGHGPTTTIGRERAANPFLLQLARP